MGVAGEGVQLAQLAEDGAPGGGAEGVDELGHGGDAQAGQGGGQGGGGEGDGSHGPIITSSNMIVVLFHTVAGDKDLSIWR